METDRIARVAGASLLGTVVLGILASLFVSQGIDINQTSDFHATAEAMGEAGSRLNARAWIAMLSLLLATATSAGFFLLLRHQGELLAWWSLILALTSSAIGLLGAIATLNVAEIAGHADFAQLGDEGQRLLLAAVQASWDYTSFHYALVIGAIANAGFFALFLRSTLLPRIVAGFALFASLFVTLAVIGRDFVPLLGSNEVTVAFLACNLLAMVTAGGTLALKGAPNAQ